MGNWIEKPNSSQDVLKTNINSLQTKNTALSQKNLGQYIEKHTELQLETSKLCFSP